MRVARAGRERKAVKSSSREITREMFNQHNEGREGSWASARESGLESLWKGRRPLSEISAGRVSCVRTRTCVCVCE